MTPRDERAGDKDPLALRPQAVIFLVAVPLMLAALASAEVLGMASLSSLGSQWRSGRSLSGLLRGGSTGCAATDRPQRSPKRTSDAISAPVIGGRLNRDRGTSKWRVNPVPPLRRPAQKVRLSESPDIGRVFARIRPVRDLRCGPGDEAIKILRGEVDDMYGKRLIWNRERKFLDDLREMSESL